MRLLVMGGTVFVGRWFTHAALAAGHEVTLFNRGTSDPAAFPEAHRVRGDRYTDLGALAGLGFDAVIDTCGYHPAPVAEAVKRIPHSLYCFVSTISVYADLSRPGVHEGSPPASLPGPLPETFDRSNDLYGPLKALCERAVHEASPRALIVRPGLIVGPHDPTDRFTYWPARAERGGVVLAPGSPARPVQLIDVRDLAGWMLSMIERSVGGVFNATGPADTLTMEQMLASCIQAAEAEAPVEWVDEAFLLERGVEPWTGLPLWLTDPQFAGMLAADCSAALGAGLRFRPLVETARDTLAWDHTRPAGPRAAGLDEALEAQLLVEWASARR